MYKLMHIYCAQLKIELCGIHNVLKFVPVYTIFATSTLPSHVNIFVI